MPELDRFTPEEFAPREQMAIPDLTADDIAFMRDQVAEFQREAEKALQSVEHFQARGMERATELAKIQARFNTNFVRRYRLYLGELAPHWYWGELVLEEPAPSAAGAG
jgi:hypothetical protein